MTTEKKMKLNWTRTRTEITIPRIGGDYQFFMRLILSEIVSNFMYEMSPHFNE